jgi:hypothetical protein
MVDRSLFDLSATNVEAQRASAELDAKLHLAQPLAREVLVTRQVKVAYSRDVIERMKIT